MSVNADSPPLQDPPPEPPWEPRAAPQHTQSSHQADHRGTNGTPRRPTTTHNQDAEKALLGALLLDPTQATQLRTEITAADFYQPRHATIWDTALRLVDDHTKTLDPLTLADALTTTGELPRLGGAPYLHDLMEACQLPANAPAYAQLVRDASRLRAVDELATKLRAYSHDPTSAHDPLTVATRLEQALDTVEAAYNRFGPHTLGHNVATGLKDLSWILTGTPPETPAPTWVQRTDGTGLFYAGHVNGVFGDPEVGKSWLAQIALVEALNNGQTAAMVDVDHNGPDHTAARLLLLGARLEHLADPTRFRYYEPEDADELRAAIADVTTHRPAVVLIDSIGEVLPMLGVKSNDSDEVTAALRTVATAPARAGCCVITIDHLPKSHEARATGFAIGSIAKKRMIRGAYIRAEAKAKPAPGQVGRITLRIEKDTLGGLRKTSGGGYVGTLVLDSTQPHVTSYQITREHAPITEEGKFRPTTIMQQVSDYISEHDGCTGTDIREAIQARPQTIQAAIKALLDEGFLSRIPGKKRAFHHHLIAHYREAEDDTLN